MMANPENQRLDIVVFGASGFTGKYAVREVLKLSKDKGNLTWGVAGRNKTKLEELLSEIGNSTGDDLRQVKIIIADVTQEESLRQMAASARVIVNCAGPYRFYGEPVVKACVASGTHHVDVSGEPLYMESMQLKYHKEAEEKGIYIVSACGFDSIPFDMGTIFLQQRFEGTVNSVETYMQNFGPRQNALHYGTWASAVNETAHFFEMSSSLKKLIPSSPTFKPKLKLRLFFHHNDVNGWCLPFPGTDRSVVMRSQHHFYKKERKRPVQIQTYMSFPSFIAVLAVCFIGIMLSVLSQFSFGRSLLLKYPHIFSLGLCSHEGPSEEDAEKTLFSVTIKGKGWKDKLSEPTDEFTESPNKKMIVNVTGRNPGYGATCTMLVMSAFIILTESDQMPSRGGVYPPGAAFANTSMIKQLNERGVKFEVTSSVLM